MIIIDDSMKPDFVEVEFYNGLNSKYLISGKYVVKMQMRDTELNKLGDAVIKYDSTEDSSNWYSVEFYQTGKFILASNLVKFIQELNMGDESVCIYNNPETKLIVLQVLDYKGNILF